MNANIHQWSVHGDDYTSKRKYNVTQFVDIERDALQKLDSSVVGRLKKYLKLLARTCQMVNKDLLGYFNVWVFLEKEKLKD
jgi:hypothetical protein